MVLIVSTVKASCVWVVHVNTVQDDLLAREIFREFVSEIQLADFILAILL